MRKSTKYIAIAAVALLVASCYKLIRVTAPKVVEAGQTFEVRIAVADDGSSVQNFTTDWSYAGIRVPEGWTVTVPEGTHQQYAEQWVYYQNGDQVASRQDMVEDDYLTELYETAAHRAGYKWVAFSSEKMIPKHMTACWRNGCDSIVMTFLVTVPADAALGDYQLDFLTGDEEDERGIYKYNDYGATNGSRLFHAGTISSLSGGRKVDNANTSLSHRITVVKPTAVVNVQDKKSEGNVYDVEGRLVQQGASPKALRKGTYIMNGKKVVKK